MDHLNPRIPSVHNPDSYILARIDWDIFATFTFKNPIPSYSIQQRMIVELLRRVAKEIYGKPCSTNPSWDLLYGLRYELGEKTARPHWHTVLAGHQSTLTNTRTIAHQVKHIWEQEVGNRNTPGVKKSSVGFAKVRPYDPTKAGAEYITKGIHIGGANSYELLKFRDGFHSGYGNETVTVLLSPRLLLEIAKRQRGINKGRGIAHFLRDLKMGSVRNPKWVQQRSLGWNGPERFRHPAGVSMIR